jgi:hypothetical protein
MTDQEHLKEMQAAEEKFRRYIDTIRYRHQRELQEKVAAAEAKGYSDGYQRAKHIEGWRMAHAQMLNIVEAFSTGSLIKGDREALEVAVARMKKVEFGT